MSVALRRSMDRIAPRILSPIPWIWLLLIPAWLYLLMWLYRPGAASDAHAYWAAWQGGLYDVPWHGPSGWSYVYSPAFAQLIWPLTLLPFTVFVAIWLALNAGVLIALVGPVLAFALAFFRWEPVNHQLITANIGLFMALAIVVGFRWPAAWAFVLLTKVTPGIGLLWFVARREWRSLGIAMLATAAVTLVSFVIAPQLWIDWGRLLATTDPATPNPRALTIVALPLQIRLVLAAVVIWWAAKRDLDWLLPVGCYLAFPLATFMHLSVLVACIPLALRRLAFPSTIPVGSGRR